MVAPTTRSSSPLPQRIQRRSSPATVVRLAQVLRRAGWTVVTFHYTGSWGSGGRFTLRNGISDAHALFEALQSPPVAERWGVDPKRILIVGHSYGGYVAARAASEERGVIGVVLLAPWDISYDARTWSAMPRAHVMRLSRRCSRTCTDDSLARHTGPWEWRFDPAVRRSIWQS